MVETRVSLVASLQRFDSKQESEGGRKREVSSSETKAGGLKERERDRDGPLKGDSVSELSGLSLDLDSVVEVLMGGKRGR